MVNDISDHLPIFTIVAITYNNNIHNKEYYKRLRTEKEIKILVKDLLAEDWNTVYQSTDTDYAYKHFLKIFMNLYNKKCPLKIYHKSTMDNKSAT